MASTEQIANEYFEKGMHAIFVNNLELGIDNLNLAKSIYEELNDEEHIILTNYGLAVGYGVMGFDSKMLSKCLNMLQYLDKKSIKGAKHYFYSCICQRYMSLGNYDSALNYGKLALQDIEENGQSFRNPPYAYVVVYVNVAYIYTQIRRFDEAFRYLKKATMIAHKNDLHQHDLTFKVIDASIQLGLGNKQYIYDNLDEILNIAKSIEITMRDYFRTIKMLIELLCDMDEFNKAISIVSALDYASSNNNDYPLALESAKLFMYIAKRQNDVDAYYKACVKFAESAIDYNEYQSIKRLEEMDTSIALSIADTPIDLI